MRSLRERVRRIAQEAVKGLTKYADFPVVLPLPPGEGLSSSELLFVFAADYHVSEENCSL